MQEVGCLIVLGFNTTLMAKVIHIMAVGETHVSWLSHTSANMPFLFSHASAEVRSENMPEIHAGGPSFISCQ